MSSRVLVVAGKDRFGSQLLEEFSGNPGFAVAYDTSPSLSRLVKLIKRRAIPVKFLLLTLACRLYTPPSRIRRFPEFRSADELLRMARAVGAEKILMFRVGQIIPPFLLEEFEVLNVHAARLPEYRGLASIYRALSERNFSQQAVLHRATSSIDGGEIIASRDFLLDDTESYCVNEKIAYGTAIQLIIDFLKEAE